MRPTGLIAAMLTLFVGVASAETLLHRAKRDQIVRVRPGDPDMAAAILKARDSLPEFLRLVTDPRPTTTGFAVKIAIPAGKNKEFFWISPFEQRDGKFTGRINNTPRTAKTVKLGQVIEFREDEIVDWLYREDDRMHGNFTACALLKRQPRRQAEAVKKSYGLSCDP